MNDVLEITLDLIKPSASNPRKTFRGLDELGATIAQTGGVLQPITVRPHPTLNGGTYELCLGERRWRASKLVKMGSIRALVVDWTDTQVLENQLVVNVLTEPEHGAPLAEHVLPNHAAFIVDASTAYMQALAELEEMRTALKAAVSLYTSPSRPEAFQRELERLERLAKEFP